MNKVLLFIALVEGLARGVLFFLGVYFAIEVIRDFIDSIGDAIKERRKDKK